MIRGTIQKRETTNYKTGTKKNKRDSFNFKTFNFEMSFLNVKRLHGAVSATQNPTLHWRERDKTSRECEGCLNLARVWQRRQDRLLYSYQRTILKVNCGRLTRWKARLVLSGHESLRTGEANTFSMGSTLRRTRENNYLILRVM